MSGGYDHQSVYSPLSMRSDKEHTQKRKQIKRMNSILSDDQFSKLKNVLPKTSRLHEEKLGSEISEGL